MNKELEEKLKKDFPKAFEECGKSPSESCMAFGCACGDGWEPIIREVCENLSPKASFAQIKEKFGCLRIYLNNSTRADEDLCWEAEKKSSKICEFCGKPGEQRRGVWIKTLCSECNDRRQ
jgi:hypothetical protein